MCKLKDRDIGSLNGHVFNDIPAQDCKMWCFIVHVMIMGVAKSKHFLQTYEISYLYDNSLWFWNVIISWSIQIWDNPYLISFPFYQLEIFEEIALFWDIFDSCIMWISLIFMSWKSSWINTSDPYSREAMNRRILLYSLFDIYWENVVTQYSSILP